MKICIIVNPHAGSAEQFERLHELLKGHREITWKETSEPSECRTFAAQAIDEGVDLIAAAGGDGTINEVLNGIMEHGGNVRFGLVPLGTGNDLARTLAISNDPRDAIALLSNGHTQPIDVIRIETRGKVAYALNAAAGGFSGQVNEVMTEELKSSWGPLAYLLGAASIIPDVQNYETFISYDDGPREAIDALNIIVANGRTVAGGKRVAPLANPQDGLLDVVVVRSCSTLELAAVGTRLMTGNYLDNPNVLHRRARRVSIESEPGMWFNIDGELLTKEPVTFTVLPGALEVVVGTDFQPEPAQG